MVGRLYTLCQPRYARPWPGSVLVVKVLARWAHLRGRRDGPRNVLVEQRHDSGGATTNPQRWVRPARGLRRWAPDWDANMTLDECKP
jgi:hypothetical protein